MQQPIHITVQVIDILQRVWVAEEQQVRPRAGDEAGGLLLEALGDRLQHGEAGRAVLVLLRGNQVHLGTDGVVEAGFGGARRAVVRDFEHVDISDDFGFEEALDGVLDVALPVVCVTGEEHAEDRLLGDGEWIVGWEVGEGRGWSLPLCRR